MNYIILNGIKSTLVKGLLIQALPPISKPLMRTSIETIDGRDGDIVTKLGYSAYNKEMSVGLFGDFDIDEVIKFFDSEGTVVFSNEPDKYYRYQIIEQIDFERLIKFKTATVTFHVQPFKYSAVNETVIRTVEGLSQIAVVNRGNTESRPRITIRGSGIVKLSINYVELFTMAVDGFITLDGEKMNAYHDEALANRSVSGNYENLKLKSGTNMISWVGNVSEIDVENVSRWI